MPGSQPTTPIKVRAAVAIMVTDRLTDRYLGIETRKADLGHSYTDLAIRKLRKSGRLEIVWLRSGISPGSVHRRELARVSAIKDDLDGLSGTT